MGTGDAPLRVVSISHSAVRHGAASRRRLRGAGQSDPSLDLTLVIPKVWHEYGKAEHAEPSRTDAENPRAGRRGFTRGGPAKWYLHYYPRPA